MKTQVKVTLDPTFVQVPAYHVVRLTRSLNHRVRKALSPVIEHFPIHITIRRVEEEVQEQLRFVSIPE